MVVWCVSSSANLLTHVYPYTSLNTYDNSYRIEYRVESDKLLEFNNFGILFSCLLFFHLYWEKALSSNRRMGYRLTLSLTLNEKIQRLCSCAASFCFSLKQKSSLSRFISNCRFIHVFRSLIPRLWLAWYTHLSISIKISRFQLEKTFHRNHYAASQPQLIFRSSYKDSELL